MHGESTNALEFKLFIEELAANKVDPTVKPFMVLDNHTSHTSDIVMPTLLKHFQPLFQPTYSCKFNSIETLWAIVKKQFRAQITRVALKRDYTVDNCKALVMMICQGLQ